MQGSFHEDVSHSTVNLIEEHNKIITNRWERVVNIMYYLYLSFTCLAFVVLLVLGIIYQSSGYYIAAAMFALVLIYLLLVASVGLKPEYEKYSDRELKLFIFALVTGFVAFLLIFFYILQRTMIRVSEI